MDNLASLGILLGGLGILLGGLGLLLLGSGLMWFISVWSKQKEGK